MGQRTPLYQAHITAGAKIVDFGGWDMPVHYGSQLDEHHAVRRDAGMFDVSHMCIVDLEGDGARGFLEVLVANNVDKLKLAGKALYTCMLNGDGGVIDDLIIYYMRNDWFRLVVNAATAEKDLNWINQQARNFSAVNVNRRSDLGMIAVQGPNARQKVLRALDKFSATGDDDGGQESVSNLGRFFGVDIDNMFFGRTGYTGEDGFEIAINNKHCESVWNILKDEGVAPCGLGARDTLRLEAGMNLYGSDMDETTTPLESGLAWTVGWEPASRRFIGRPALEAQRAAGLRRKLAGLVLLERGVLRSHQKVFCEQQREGEITSGSFSPTLSKSIALARLPSTVNIGDRCKVEIRGKQLPAKVVRYPFVKDGQSCI